MWFPTNFIVLVCALKLERPLKAGVTAIASQTCSRETIFKNVHVVMRLIDSFWPRHLRAILRADRSISVSADRVDAHLKSRVMPLARTHTVCFRKHSHSGGVQQKQDLYVTSTIDPKNILDLLYLYNPLVKFTLEVALLGISTTYLVCCFKGATTLK